MKRIWIPLFCVAALTFSEPIIAQTTAKTALAKKQTPKKRSQEEIFLWIKNHIEQSEDRRQEGVIVERNSIFTTDLNFDSLDIVEFVIDAEKEFGFTMSDEVIVSIFTVTDAVEIIDDLVQNKRNHRYLITYSGKEYAKHGGIKLTFLTYNDKTKKYETASRIQRVLLKEQDDILKYPQLNIGELHLIEVEIPKGYQLTCYSKTNFKGTKTEIVAKDKNLPVHIVNENVNSFVLKKI